MAPSADGHLAASAELTRAENTGDYGRFIEIAEASVSGLLASAADAKDGPRDRTVQGRTHRQRLVDEAATAKLTEAASRISSVLESLQGAIKARAYAAEEHRAFDATGGNGSDITRAFDRALADAGINTQVYWSNSLDGANSGLGVRGCQVTLHRGPAGLI